MRDSRCDRSSLIMGKAFKVNNATHLSNECDRLLSHSVCISNVGLDHCFEGFLSSLLMNEMDNAKYLPNTGKTPSEL